jgi:hypothetical protein
MTQEIRPARYPKVSNLLLVLANTEYSFKLSSNVRRFLVRAREAVAFKLSFQANESATNYLGILSGEQWTEEEVYGDVTLYIQTTEANTTIEILQWVEQ